MQYLPLIVRNFTMLQQKKENITLVYCNIVCQISPAELTQQQISILRKQQHSGELIITLSATIMQDSHMDSILVRLGKLLLLNCLMNIIVLLLNIQLMATSKKLVSLQNGYSLKSFLWHMRSNSLYNYGSNYLTNLISQFISEIASRNNIQALYEYVKTVQFANKLKKCDQDLFQHYMFFSYIFCTKQLKKECIAHQSICVCSNPKISLYIGYNSEDYKLCEKLQNRKHIRQRGNELPKYQYHQNKLINKKQTFQFYGFHHNDTNNSQISNSILVILIQHQYLLSNQFLNFV